MNGKYKRLGRNTILVFIGGIGSKLITFLMLPYYTSHLSAAEYGTSDMVTTYSTIFISIIFCCIAEAIFIFPKGKPVFEQAKYFSSGLIFALTSLLVWICLSIGISSLNTSSVFVEYIWWILWMASSMFIQGYIQQFTLSCDKIIVYSTTSIIQVFATAILALVFIPLKGLEGYLISLILANLIGALYSFTLSKSFCYFRIANFDKAYLFQLLKYGIPLIPNTIVWWLVNGVNRPIMESELGLEAVGIYGVASRIPSIIVILFTFFTNAWNISLLEEFGKPDFNVFFNKIVRVVFSILVLGTVMLILGSKLIVSILASHVFYEAWKYVPILCIAAIFQCLSSVVGGVFAAEKKSKYYFYSSVWGAIISLIATYGLVGILGIHGVTCALLCSFLSILIIRLIYAWKHISLFDYKYYSIASLLLLILAIAVTSEVDRYVILMISLTILGYVLLSNRNNISHLFLIFKGLRNRHE